MKEALIAQKRDLTYIQEHLHGKREVESQIDKYARLIVPTYLVNLFNFLILFVVTRGRLSSCSPIWTDFVIR